MSSETRTTSPKLWALANSLKTLAKLGSDSPNRWRNSVAGVSRDASGWMRRTECSASGWMKRTLPHVRRCSATLKSILIVVPVSSATCWSERSGLATFMTRMM